MEPQDAGLREAGYGQLGQQDAGTRGCGMQGRGVRDMGLQGMDLGTGFWAAEVQGCGVGCRESDTPGGTIWSHISPGFCTPVPVCTKALGTQGQPRFGDPLPVPNLCPHRDPAQARRWSRDPQTPRVPPPRVPPLTELRFPPFQASRGRR